MVWGLDFTGGTQIQVTFPNDADLSAIRANLAKNGFKDAEVISYGNAQDVLISTSSIATNEQTELVDKVMHALPAGAVKQGVDFVGPQVGKELATKGALAILVSLLATMIYIALRFEYRLAISSAVALIHDPVLILGIFAMFDIEFDLKALAGLLAVIGYFLNDTIVVFETIHGFALALIIGIVVGTYSSIYVAGALAVSMGLSSSDFSKTKKKYLDDVP